MSIIKHIATEEDLSAIQKGIKTVWHKKLSPIFKNKKLLENTLVVSYDSKNIYFWVNKDISGIKKINYEVNNFFSYQMPHSIEIPEIEHLGWRAGIIPLINNVLPKVLQKDDFEMPKVSGSLLTNFIATQKKIKGERSNPYITYESYLATIVHEFGHVYFNQSKLWYYSDKKENIRLLKEALLLYQGKKIDKITNPYLPSPYLLSETFAFCADYTATSIFWPNHKKDIDKANIERIKVLIKEETEKNLDEEDSVLGENAPHNTAFTLGKILLHLYPNTWQQKILNRTTV